MSKFPVNGTVWVSPRMIFPRDAQLRLIASAEEEIQYDKRDFSTPDPDDWKWSESERVRSFKWSIDNESEITVSISLDIPKDHADLSKSVALAFASIPHQIRGSQSYTIAIDDRDRDRAYYDPNNHKVILGHEETLNSIADGFLEELLLHEVAHAEVDAYFYNSTWNGIIDLGWSNAVSQDSGRFISDYASDYPLREDVAETILPLAAILTVDPARLNLEDKAYLLASASWVPGRYAYLAEQVFGNSEILSQKLASFLQIVFTGTKGADTLTGNSANNMITGLSGKDTLTGLGGEDTFKYALNHSLLSGYDRITDFAIGTDKIDGPKGVSAVNLKELGRVSALNQKSIATILTNKVFRRNGAAAFTYGSGTAVRTFLALNDKKAGFSSATDAVIGITGFTGNLTDLTVI